MESAVLAGEEYRNLSLDKAFQSLPPGMKQRVRKEITRRIWIFQPLRLVYVTTPKVGTSSLLRHFHAMAGVEMSDTAILNRQPSDPGVLSVKHFGFRPFLQEINSDSWIRVAAVRNPYLRILSCYLNKLHGRTAIADTSMISAAKRVGFVEGKGLDFTTFLRNVSEQEPRNMNGHWCPQSNLILPEKIRYNAIIRLESFNEDFRALLKILDSRYTDFDRVYNSTSSEKRIDKFYTSEAVDLARNIYSEDFSEFDYSTEFNFS